MPHQCKMERGRTMLEVIFVMAIMGLLTVLGMEWYNYASAKVQAKDVLDNARKQVLFLTEEDEKRFNQSSLVKGVMLKDSIDTQLSAYGYWIDEASRKSGSNRQKAQVRVGLSDEGTDGRTISKNLCYALQGQVVNPDDALYGDLIAIDFPEEGQSCDSEDLSRVTLIFKLRYDPVSVTPIPPAPPAEIGCPAGYDDRQDDEGYLHCCIDGYTYEAPSTFSYNPEICDCPPNGDWHNGKDFCCGDATNQKWLDSGNGTGSYTGEDCDAPPADFGATCESAGGTPIGGDVCCSNTAQGYKIVNFDPVALELDTTNCPVVPTPTCANQGGTPKNGVCCKNGYQIDESSGNPTRYDPESCDCPDGGTPTIIVNGDRVCCVDNKQWVDSGTTGTYTGDPCVSDWCWNAGGTWIGNLCCSATDPGWKLTQGGGRSEHSGCCADQSGSNELCCRLNGSLWMSDRGTCCGYNGEDLVPVQNMQEDEPYVCCQGTTNLGGVVSGNTVCECFAQGGNYHPDTNCCETANHSCNSCPDNGTSTPVNGDEICCKNGYSWDANSQGYTGSNQACPCPENGTRSDNGYCCDSNHFAPDNETGSYTRYAPSECGCPGYGHMEANGNETICCYEGKAWNSSDEDYTTTNDVCPPCEPALNDGNQWLYGNLQQLTSSSKRVCCYEGKYYVQHEGAAPSYDGWDEDQHCPCPSEEDLSPAKGVCCNTDHCAMDSWPHNNENPVYNTYDARCGCPYGGTETDGACCNASKKLWDDTLPGCSEDHYVWNDTSIEKCGCPIVDGNEGEEVKATDGSTICCSGNNKWSGDSYVEDNACLKSCPKGINPTVLANGTKMCCDEGKEWNESDQDYTTLSAVCPCPGGTEKDYTNKCCDTGEELALKDGKNVCCYQENVKTLQGQDYCCPEGSEENSSDCCVAKDYTWTGGDTVCCYDVNDIYTWEGEEFCCPEGSEDSSALCCAAGGGAWTDGDEQCCASAHDIYTASGQEYCCPSGSENSSEACCEAANGTWENGKCVSENPCPEGQESVGGDCCYSEKVAETSSGKVCCSASTYPSGTAGSQECCQAESDDDYDLIGQEGECCGANEVYAFRTTGVGTAIMVCCPLNRTIGDESFPECCPAGQVRVGRIGSYSSCCKPGQIAQTGRNETACCTDDEVVIGTGNDQSCCASGQVATKNNIKSCCDGGTVVVGSANDQECCESRFVQSGYCCPYGSENDSEACCTAAGRSWNASANICCSEGEHVENGECVAEEPCPEGSEETSEECCTAAGRNWNASANICCTDGEQVVDGACVAEEPCPEGSEETSEECCEAAGREWDNDVLECCADGVVTYTGEDGYQRCCNSDAVSEAEECCVAAGYNWATGDNGECCGADGDTAVARLTYTKGDGKTYCCYDIDDGSECCEAAGYAWGYHWGEQGETCCADSLTYKKAGNTYCCGSEDDNKSCCEAANHTWASAGEGCGDNEHVSNGHCCRENYEYENGGCSAQSCPHSNQTRYCSQKDANGNCVYDCCDTPDFVVYSGVGQDGADLCCASNQTVANGRCVSPDPYVQGGLQALLDLCPVGSTGYSRAAGRCCTADEVFVEEMYCCPAGTTVYSPVTGCCSPDKQQTYLGQLLVCCDAGKQAQCTQYNLNNECIAAVCK